MPGEDGDGKAVVDRRGPAHEAARLRYLGQVPGVHRQAGQRYPMREELHAREGRG